MNSESIVHVPLAQLRAHPSNSNVMAGPLLEKLTQHIQATGHYPPLIVRRLDAKQPTWQVIDGHHRWRVLERLGHAAARCVVWDVDDDQALLLLATLNRLQGQDDPARRSQLLVELSERMKARSLPLAKLLPETSAQFKKLLTLCEPRPRPRAAPRLDDMPRAVHFFLLPAQRRQLEARLAELGGSREQALMQLAQRRND